MGKYSKSQSLKHTHTHTRTGESSRREWDGGSERTTQASKNHCLHCYALHIPLSISLFRPFGLCKLRVIKCSSRIKSVEHAKRLKRGREREREKKRDEATRRDGALMLRPEKYLTDTLARSHTHTTTQPHDTNTDAAAARNRKAARASNVSILNKYFQLNITIRSSRG